MSAAGRRVRGARVSLGFLDLAGDLAGFSAVTGASTISGGASDSRSPAVPSSHVSAITPYYQMRTPNSGRGATKRKTATTRF